MPSFKKLRKHLRRPLAAFLAVALVVATIPLVQSGTDEALADESSSTQTTYEVTGSTWSDLSKSITITYDGESLGTVVAGSYTVSDSTVQSYAEDQLLTESDGTYTAKDSDSTLTSNISLTYASGGSDALSDAVDNLIAQLEAEHTDSTTESTSISLSTDSTVTSTAIGSDTTDDTTEDDTTDDDSTTDDTTTDDDSTVDSTTDDDTTTDDDKTEEESTETTYTVTATNVVETVTTEVTTYSDFAYVSGSASYTVTGFTAVLALQSGSELLVPEEGQSYTASGVTLSYSDGTYTVSSTGGISDDGVTLVVAITAIEYSYSFSCSYTTTVTTTTTTYTYDTWTTTGSTAEGTSITSDQTITSSNFSSSYSSYDWTKSVPSVETTTSTPSESDGTITTTTSSGSSSTQTAEVSGVTTTTGKVYDVDAWDDLEVSDLAYATITDASSDSDGDGDTTFTYDDTVTQTATSEFTGLTATVSYSEAGIVEATVEETSTGTYTLTVTALAAEADGVTIYVQWYYPNGDALGEAQSVVVEAVDAYTIYYSLSAQDFRKAGRQEAHVLDDANTQVRAAIEAAGFTAPDSDYYDAVSITSEDDYYADALGSASYDVAVTFETADATYLADYDNYDVVDATSFEVSPVTRVDWSETDLTITATYLETAESIVITSSTSSTWVNGVSYASWSGYRLAYASESGIADTTFTSTITSLNTGDGTHSLALYAIDSDGVIYYVENISYKLDRTSPTLASLTVDDSSAEWYESIIFGESLDVTVIVADYLGSATSDAVDTVTLLQSGLTELTVTYYDEENDQSVTAVSTTYSLDASGNATATRTESFTVTGDKDVLASSISIKAVDAAGNVLTATGTTANEGNIPSEYVELVADSSGPTVSVSWDTTAALNGSYYTGSRTMTVTVTDEFFNYVQDYDPDQVILTISQDGTTVVAVHPGDFTQTGTNTWQYSYTFTADADWVVSTVTVEDIVGHVASAEGDSFTIDNTAPVLSVTFDNNDASNGIYYSASRTATITVNEHNFDSSLVTVTYTADAGNGTEVGAVVEGSWSTSGDVSTLTVTFPGEGVYTLTVSGTDLALNSMSDYSSSEFVIDTVAPTISIEDILNKTAYSDEAAPTVTITDTNLDTSSQTTIVITKIGYSFVAGDDADYDPYTESVTISASATELLATYLNPAAEKANDGVYTLTVYAVDLAGNVTTDAVTWSVNRFGSTYVITDETAEMIGDYLQSDDVVDVVVLEINPSGLDSTLTSVGISHDTSYSTLEADNAAEGFTTVESTESGWYEYEYTVASTIFDSDGTYRVLFSSTDAAGNVSENTSASNSADEVTAAEVSFAVDDTAPLASFVNLESATYDASSYEASVKFEDNLCLSHAQIVVTVNGSSTTYEITAEMLEESTTQSFTLSESTEAQSVTVTVWDAAGNETTIDLSDVYVTTNTFVQLANSGILYLLIALIILALLIIFFLVWKRRKKDEETQAKAA